MTRAQSYSVKKKKKHAPCTFADRLVLSPCLKSRHSPSGYVCSASRVHPAVPELRSAKGRTGSHSDQSGATATVKQAGMSVLAASLWHWPRLQVQLPSLQRTSDAVLGNHTAVCGAMWRCPGLLVSEWRQVVVDLDFLLPSATTARRACVMRRHAPGICRIGTNNILLLPCRGIKSQECPQLVPSHLIPATVT